MRRRLEVFIPIVLLSIMVQLLAPIGAFPALQRLTIPLDLKDSWVVLAGRP